VRVWVWVRVRVRVWGREGLGWGGHHQDQDISLNQDPNRIVIVTCSQCLELKASLTLKLGGWRLEAAA
jgi:hypothetical protein